MSLPDHHEEANAPISLFGTARNRLAIVLLGLVGYTAMPACTASFCTNINTPDGVRATAVDEDGQRIFVVPDAVATVHLMNADKDPKELKASLKLEASIGTDKDSKKEPPETCMCNKSKIRGILNVLPSSPIFKNSKKSRAFKLPESAYPWIELIVDPSDKGGIMVSMRMEDDQIAMIFDCSGSTVKEDGYCKGKEIDPEELNKLIAANAKNLELERKAEAKKKAEKDKKDKKDDKVAETSETPIVSGSIMDDEVAVRGDISDKIDQLIPHIKKLTWEEQKALMYELGGDTEELRQFVEEVVEIGERNGVNDLVRLKIVEKKIYRLIAFNSAMIPALAEKLDITLKEVKAVKEMSSDVLEKIKLLLGPTPLDKLKIAAKMISVEGFHKKIDEESKGQVTARIMDLFRKHYRSKDFVPLIKVLTFLKGELKEKSDASSKEKAVVAELRRLLTELPQQIKGIKRAKEDLDRIGKKLKSH